MTILIIEYALALGVGLLVWLIKDSKTGKRIVFPPLLAIFLFWFGTEAFPCYGFPAVLLLIACCLLTLWGWFIFPYDKRYNSKD